MEGGKGNDQLVGGKGDDQYNFNTLYQGIDVIADSDGQIYVNQLLLSGKAQKNNNTAQLVLDDQIWILEKIKKDLHLSIDNQKIIIKNFKNGKFGISL